MSAISVHMRRDRVGLPVGVDVWIGQFRQRFTVDEAEQLALDLDATVRVARAEQEMAAEDGAR